MPNDPAVADPLAALAVFAAALLFAVLLLWPRRGLAWRVVRLLRVTERVRIEDALKQLYKGEYEGIPESVESVAGALRMTTGQAAKLLSRVEEMGLVRADGRGFPLTAEGRAYALRVLRTHRLWERYLADRTGVRPEEWHEEAEREEHRLTPSDAEDLSAALGNPLYDPHGDPIPTASGELPPKRGIPLTRLAPGKTAVVSHVEDEPPEVYERLVAERLGPLTRVERLASAPGEIRFRTERRTHALEPVVANNITVEPIDLEVSPGDGLLTLAEADLGEEGTVTGLSAACQGGQRRRLLDLGVVPGTRIRAEFRGPGGEATAYRIRGALIALRRRQASWIRVGRSRKR